MTTDPSSPTDPAATALRERALKTIRQHRLFEPAPPAPPAQAQPRTRDRDRVRVVVGVSGGADSMALLHVLGSLRETLHLELHAASLDHGLRGAAGAADMAFVAEAAQAWGIAVHTSRIDTAAVSARHRLSIETAARAERYAFFARIARDIGAHYVAVAHHADDQAETVLMRLLRGTGSGGLAAMRPRALLPEASPAAPRLWLVRPLLNSTRAAIEGYCAAVGITPRHDASNDTTDFLRNRIRIEVMPYLKTLNPQIVRGLARLGESAAQDEAFFRDALEAQQEALDFRSEPGAASVRRDVFRAQPDALQRRVLLALMAAVGVEHDHHYDQIVAAVATARAGRVGAVVLLAHGLRMRVTRDRIFVEGGAAPDSPTPAAPDAVP